LRYFFDTEFLELGGHIQLISIGIVSEQGQAFYAENKDFNWEQEMDPWLRENVLPHLSGGGAEMSIAEMRHKIIRFVDSEPQFWGYYSSYDWVCFCLIFGRMVDLPKHFPKRCNDLMQLIEAKGFPKEELPKQDSAAHQAVNDAYWNLAVWQKLSAEEK
jgi:hypothetical protein